MNIAFFGSSLVSAYWNGAATYYRGIIRMLHERGHWVTFYEPDVLDRQKHRDLDHVPYARSVVYPAESEAQVLNVLREARNADVVIKASGVGVFDQLLEEAVLELKSNDRAVIFWDVDAPATLERMGKEDADPFKHLVPDYDMIIAYGGGDPVVRAYASAGARRCEPVYNAFDPDTHFPAPADPRFEGTLGFVGNRLPDREERVREFFHRAATLLPGERFLLAGSGWDGADQPANVRYLGHLYTKDHNAFNRTPLAVLNVLREGMVRFGYSPATRVFEAAGAGACLITDKWEGVELFLAPGRECLVAADGAEVAQHLKDLTPEKAASIGNAAMERVFSEHTYAHRASQVEDLLAEAKSRSSTPSMEEIMPLNQTSRSPSRA